MEKKTFKSSYRSTWNNVIYANRTLFKRYREVKWQIVFYIILTIMVPFLNTAMPSVAISTITKGDMRGFLFAMGGMIFITNVTMIGKNMVSTIVGRKRTNARLNTFFYGLIEKNLCTDYVNVEPKDKQTALEKGSRAVNSNYDGAEGLMTMSIEFLTYVIGITVYGMSVIFVDIRILFVLIASFVIDMFLRNHAIKYQDSLRDMNSDIYKKQYYIKNNGLDLKAGKDVRVYQMEGWFHLIYEGLIKAAAIYEKKIALRWYIPSFVNHITLSFRDIFTYYILIHMVLTGKISVPTFTLYLGIISGFSDWMFRISLSISDLRRYSHNMDQYIDYMDTKDVYHHEDGEVLSSTGSQYKIEFEEVSFRYPNTKEDILSQVSFVICPGEKIALVGHNGAGKTTIIKLLCGFYQPTSGRILINDQDMMTLNLPLYQSLLSVIFQDLNPLSFTIAMNVACCEPEFIDENRLIQSLKKSGLWDKVNSLEMGVNTYLTQTFDESGINLSGGELQKLLLARAIYKNGPILILDEPTAALDPIAESKMYEEYNELTKDKSSIFISHRLASTKFCDRIIFLEHGRIMEVGSHEQLIQMKGKYKEIFDLQSHYYVEEDHKNEN